jgi:hypothetical protein
MVDIWVIGRWISCIVGVGDEDVNVDVDGQQIDGPSSLYFILSTPETKAEFV